jgi:hypothetical protein
MAIFNAGVIEAISFSENKGSNNLKIDDLLIFTDGATTPFRSASSIDTVLISDAPRVKNLDVSTSDFLSIAESGARGHDLASAFDLLNIGDRAGLFVGGPTSESLVITESVTEFSAKGFHDTLTLTESATVRNSVAPVTPETVTINEVAIGHVIGCRAKDIRNPITLISGSTTLTLGGADFGDIRRRDFQRINRRSRGNDLIIYRDPSWTISEHLTVRMSGMNGGQRDNLLNFLEFTTGQLVRMVDYETNLWEGFIMNPNTPMTQTGNCKFETELQFQGRVISYAG